MHGYGLTVFKLSRNQFYWGSRPETPPSPLPLRDKSIGSDFSAQLRPPILNLRELVKLVSPTRGFKKFLERLARASPRPP